MRRAPAAAVLAAVAVAGLSAALWPAASPAAAPAAATAATGVLSPRRIPGILRTAVGDARLAAALDAALADPALGAARDASCLRVAGPDGRLLFDRRPDVPLIPASNLKLLTAAAALRELGPGERLHTDVRGRVDGSGAVGDLFLVGGGDPLLATGDYVATFDRQPQAYTPLEELARRVRAAGVTTVGRVVGDESRYDTQRYIPTWKRGYIADNEAGPQSALTVNDGFAAFEPKRIPADRPATHAAEVFTTLLRNAGVTVVGVPGEGAAPAGLPTIATLESLPVSEIVAEMLRESDNLTAELLVKELGRDAGAPVGTTAAGLAVITGELRELRLPTEPVRLVDGSGLDRLDRATCDAIHTLLADAGPRSPIARALPVANRSGTLQKRFAGNPAAGKLRAKTGSLDGVSALSGFAEADGGTLSFSMLLNGLPRDALGPVTWERVGAALVRYPDAPPRAELAPRP